MLNGSIADQKGMPGLSVYGGSKAALCSFARSWLMDLKERRIRVNVLSPGPIDTPAMQKAPEAARTKFKSIIPLGRVRNVRRDCNCGAHLRPVRSPLAQRPSGRSRRSASTTLSTSKRMRVSLLIAPVLLYKTSDYRENRNGDGQHVQKQVEAENFDRSGHVQRDLRVGSNQGGNARSHPLWCDDRCGAQRIASDS